MIEKWTKRAPATPKPVNNEVVRLAREEVLPRVQQLVQGKAGVSLADVPGLVDQFRPMDAADRNMLRALVLDELKKAGITTKDAAHLHGEATPERLVGLLAGEVFDLPHLPTSAKEAVQQLSEVHARLFGIADDAAAARERLSGVLGHGPSPLGPAQQRDVAMLREEAKLRADAAALHAAAQAFSDLRAEGKAQLSDRVVALLAQPVVEGGPTLGRLVDDATRGDGRMPLELVPAVLDRLLDLNPVELRSLRRTMVPRMSSEAAYAALGADNPLQGRTTPDKLIQMLAGAAHKGQSLPTTPEQFDAAIEAARVSGRTSEVERLTAVRTALLEVPRNHGMQDTAFMLELSVRSGKKGVYSYGYEHFFELGARDRKTGKRSTDMFQAVFLRTPVTLNTYTRSAKKGSGAEMGVNLPFTFVSVGNPVLGPRAGIYIPLVANATISGNGTIGGGIVLPIPILPGVSFGVNLYLTDPRFLTVIDPVLDAALRGTRALKKLAQPLIDKVADWQARRDEKKGKDVLSPLRLRLNQATDAAPVGRASAVTLSPGAALELDSTHDAAKVRIGRTEVEVFLGADPPSAAQLTLGDDGTTLTLDMDGTQHVVGTLPMGTGAASLYIGNDDVLVCAEQRGGTTGACVALTAP